MPEWKRKTAAGLMEAAGKLVDRLNSEALTKEASLKDQSIAAGILLDKAGQLRAEPTQIVEHRLEVGQNLGGWLGDRAEKIAPERTIDAEFVENQGKKEQSDGLSNIDAEKTGAETVDEGEGGEKSPPPPS